MQYVQSGGCVQKTGEIESALQLREEGKVVRKWERGREERMTIQRHRNSVEKVLRWAARRSLAVRLAPKADVVGSSTSMSSVVDAKAAMAGEGGGRSSWAADDEEVRRFSHSRSWKSCSRSSVSLRSSTRVVTHQ